MERAENGRRGMSEGASRCNFPAALRATYVRRISSVEFSPVPLSRTKTATTCATRAPCSVLVGLQLLPSGVCWVGWVNRRCSISLRSFHARMETGCGGLHVLLRAPANSCKGVADDYNVVDIVVYCDLTRSIAKLHRRCYLMLQQSGPDLPLALYFALVRENVPPVCLYQKRLTSENDNANGVFT